MIEHILLSCFVIPNLHYIEAGIHVFLIPDTVYVLESYFRRRVYIMSMCIMLRMCTLCSTQEGKCCRKCKWTKLRREEIRIRHVHKAGIPTLSGCDQGRGGGT